MHFVFATYRWHPSLVGGAELHHRRLARELVDLGHKVTVLTTDGLGIRPFCHWGVMWERMAGVESEDEFPTVRLPVKLSPRWKSAWEVKRLQKRIEREEQETPLAFLRQLLEPAPDAVHLLTGWHHSEMVNGEPRRWTQRRVLFAVKRTTVKGGTVTINGDLPKPQTMRLYQGDHLIGEQSLQPGFVQFRCEATSDEQLFRLEFSKPWRPLRDFRSLCMQVNCVGWESPAGNVYADMQNDYRALGRLSPDLWQEHLLNRSESRPVKYSHLLDRLRGPIALGWEREIKRLAPDHVIHCNLPWSNMSHVMDGDLAMPLWHVEDDFYYWKHWVAALRRTRFVLANTPYTAGAFYPKLGIGAHFVGPPIWEPSPVGDEERLVCRESHGISPNEVVVLTVCRKSGEKRYESIARAVAQLRSEGLKVRMLGAGPDVDKRPFDYDGCLWLGRVEDAELQLLYGACDIFALMSESESFGMVIPEAWHHGKPVVVNRACGPSASLVDVDVDGLLALPGEELVNALRRYILSAELRNSHGAAGHEKARRLYVRGAAARRLLDALAG